ncbi:hypothetical protein Egran_00359 [Elaphomyces granulatus]|uniref:TauD/TfdA-like domain-containing protein n=1 Tax=Elaphomyces granulatus TaxID=519963 RepID=A0A232M661_9EURO|nr:hypothetical protein Egran_00359 [Elaphomyces granulatus]
MAPEADVSSMGRHVVANGAGLKQDKPINTVHNILPRGPLRPNGVLKDFKSFDVTPIIGTEFPDSKLTDWMKAPNSDALLRDLAITISRRGVVFFRSQTDLTDNLQKKLAQRLGELTEKPSTSSLHIHPLVNFDMDNTSNDRNVNVITTDQVARPAEDLFVNHVERPLGARGGWHTDIGYETCPADYTILNLVALPSTGGDTLWASSCEIYDKISPAYRQFLETLTASFAQIRYPITAKARGFEIYSDERGSPENIGVSLNAVHPVVRTNPVTGWKSLFAVGNHMQRINGLTTEESRRLHDWFLQLIVENHDCQLLAIWDNRTVLHSATMDFAGLGPRTGHRVVSIGERPYMDPNSKTRREALAAEAAKLST